MRRMAGLQVGILLLLAAAAAIVENLQVYFWQPWAYKESTAEVAVARSMPWDILFLGSSEVRNGVIPPVVDAALARRGIRAQSHDLGIYGAVVPTDRLAYGLARTGHRPRIVVLALAPRDLNGEASRDRLRVTVESVGSLRDAVSLASTAPRRRYRLPWYAFCRDLSVPVQAIAAEPTFRNERQVVAARRGSAWGGDPEEQSSTRPSGNKVPRLQSVANELANYDPWEFTDQTVLLIDGLRRDGAIPLILVMPLSDWADAQLPDGATIDFESALTVIQARTAVPVERSTDLVPELRSGRLYWDHVDHLGLDGARALSNAIGDVLATKVLPGLPE